jgi:hypothetical protein
LKSRFAGRTRKIGNERAVEAENPGEKRHWFSCQLGAAIGNQMIAFSCGLARNETFTEVAERAGSPLVETSPGKFTIP